MKKSTLIALVTVLIVVTLGGTCIGFLGFSVWEDIRLQQGEIMHKPDEVEITYTGLCFDTLPGSDPEEMGGECFLVANVTNAYDFGLAWVGIDVNYTEYGKEYTVWTAIHHLKPNETREVRWSLPAFYKPEECNEERFKNFKPVEITAYKYKNGISVSTETAEEWDAKGISFAKSGEYQKAIECFDKAIDLNPNFAEAYCNRGVTYCHLKQYERAIEDYAKAIELNPNLAEPYCNRGNAYFYLKQYERAIEDYDKAIELNPSYALAYSNRGFTYCCLKQYERAIEDCDKAIELDSNLAGAYTNRGNAYKDLGQYERAIEDYDKAIELDPNDAEAYDNRELALSKLKEQKTT